MTVHIWDATGSRCTYMSEEIFGDNLVGKIEQKGCTNKSSTEKCSSRTPTRNILIILEWASAGHFNFAFSTIYVLCNQYFRENVQIIQKQASFRIISYHFMVFLLIKHSLYCFIYKEYYQFHNDKNDFFIHTCRVLKLCFFHSLHSWLLLFVSQEKTIHVKIFIMGKNHGDRHQGI